MKFMSYPPLISHHLFVEAAVRPNDAPAESKPVAAPTTPASLAPEAQAAAAVLAAESRPAQARAVPLVPAGCEGWFG